MRTDRLSPLASLHGLPSLLLLLLLLLLLFLVSSERHELLRFALRSTHRWGSGGRGWRDQRSICLIRLISINNWLTYWFSWPWADSSSELQRLEPSLKIENHSLVWSWQLFSMCVCVCVWQRTKMATERKSKKRLKGKMEVRGRKVGESKRAALTTGPRNR